MTTQFSTVQFHDQTLITFEQDNVQYVAMRPICENIGLAWGSQYERINRDEVLNSVVLMIRTTGNDGKEYQMICLPIDYLNGWLFGIDVKRVKPEIRDLLITYKKECYKALADYWIKGKAERELQNSTVIQPDEEALNLIVRLYHFCAEAQEMREKICVYNNRHIISSIEKDVGGHYLHNLGFPLKNVLDETKKYIHEKSERIMFIKGMLSLIDEPKRLKA